MSMIWPSRGPLFDRDTRVCKTINYSYADKIVDTSIGLVLLLYYLNSENSDIKVKVFITLLFIYRLIGVLLFFVTKKEVSLIWFPNFFLETLLTVTLLGFLNIEFASHKSLYLLLITFVFIFKVIQEYILHSTLTPNRIMKPLIKEGIGTNSLGGNTTRAK